MSGTASLPNSILDCLSQTYYTVFLILLTILENFKEQLKISQIRHQARREADSNAFTFIPHTCYNEVVT